MLERGERRPKRRAVIQGCQDKFVSMASELGLRSGDFVRSAKAGIQACENTLTAHPGAPFSVASARLACGEEKKDAKPRTGQAGFPPPRV